MHPDRLLWKIVGCAFDFDIALIFTASDPEVLVGQGSSSHPTQEAMLFLTPTALDPKDFGRTEDLLHIPNRRARLFLTTTALDPEYSAGQGASSHPTRRDPDRFGRTGSFFTSQHEEARLFLITTALDSANIRPDIVSKRRFLAKDTNTHDQHTERTHLGCYYRQRYGILLKKIRRPFSEKTDLGSY